MNIFVYSDESGVFDKAHEHYFVFGGVVFLNKESKDICTRKYSAAEKVIRKKCNFEKDNELKAIYLPNNCKGKLVRSLNNEYKFGVVINQRRVLDRIYQSKKDKQRYLDYAYKIGIKRFFQYLINEQIILPREVEHLYFNIDEHTTATNGCYELKEGLEQEFKRGTYNYNYNKSYDPIFSNLSDVQLDMCDSSKKTLIRAADIVANRIFFLLRNGSVASDENKKLFISYLP